MSDQVIHTIAGLRRTVIKGELHRLRETGWGDADIQLASCVRLYNTGDTYADGSPGSVTCTRLMINALGALEGRWDAGEPRPNAHGRDGETR